ncbi:MAG TPA: hypothetical protein VNG31_01115 [Candidatus Baltobacteraceae bacterium]|nr:hypothetical protein [Candidatus Baltobacteraceae bacterium]
MTLYDAMLFVHLLTIAAAFFAVGMMLSSLLRLPACRDLRDAGAALRTASSIGRIMPIATLLLLVSGGVMTQAQWNWRTPWIDVGIVALLVVTAIGGGLIGSRERAMHRAIEAAGAGAVIPTAAPLLFDRTILLANGVNVGIICGVMLLMVLKGSLIGSAACVLAGAILGYAVAALATKRAAHLQDFTLIEEVRVETSV